MRQRRLSTSIRRRNREIRAAGIPRLCAAELLEDRLLLASITGHVFQDLDADGAQGPGEPGHAGVTVYLDQNQNGLVDPGEQTALTDSAGNYQFLGLTTALYTVAEQVPVGWLQTSPTPAAPDAIQRVSIRSLDSIIKDDRYMAKVSADGRFVAFESRDSGLVLNDTNASRDIFVYDRQTGTTERVSVSSSGIQGNGESTAPSISTDGRFVAFESAATNLVEGDTNNAVDAFVFDRQSRTLARVSVGPGGTQASGSSPSISADGRHVAFTSGAANLVPADDNGAADVFVYDRITGQTERVSVSDLGVEGNQFSSSPAISADGRHVAFLSRASNLVAGDTNGLNDVFVYDRQARQLERVSISSSGVQANNNTNFGPSISGDGRVVAFASHATNLVPGDSNPASDVFLFDREARTMERASVNSSGIEANNQSEHASISADGRFVAFESLANNLVSGDNGFRDVFVYDRHTRRTARVNLSATGAEAGSDTFRPALSADGRYVAFDSHSGTLVPEDSGSPGDVFLANNPLTPQSNSQSSFVLSGVDETAAPFGNHPASTIEGFVFADQNGNGLQEPGEHGLPGATVFLDTDGDYILGAGERASTTDGSGNYEFGYVVRGNYVVRTLLQPGWVQTSPAFNSNAGVQQISRVPAGAPGDGASGLTSMSADGRFVAFQSLATNLVPGDTNGLSDVFVFDRASEAIERITARDGENGSAVISADGRYVAFISYAGRHEVMLYDRHAGTVEAASLGVNVNTTARPSISGDGRFVAFTSSSSELVPLDTNGHSDVFVYDRQSNLVERVSVTSAGGQADGLSIEPFISDDGSSVAFSSRAANLVPGDTNNALDVFVYDRRNRTVERVSVSSDGQQASGSAPSLSADGRYVAFSSDAWNLVPLDSNSNSDVFVHDRHTRAVERVTVNSNGAEAIGPRSSRLFPSISADGRYVAFTAEATNLVPDDTNNAADVFVYDRETRGVSRVNVGPAGILANAGSDRAFISADGRYVGFQSVASNLTDGDTNATADVFVSPNTNGVVPQGIQLSVAAGELFQRINFGVAIVSGLSGRIWLDRDLDGVMGPSESPIEGVEVLIQGIYTYDDDDDVVIYEGRLRERTKADGTFEVFGLPPGNYRVQAVTSAAIGLRAVTPTILELRVGEGEHVSGLQFGYFKPIQVSTLLDERDADRSAGDLSLREALEMAGADPGIDVIEFAPSVGGIISLQSSLGQLVIDSDVIIDGPGAEKLTIDAQGQSRAMYVAPGAQVKLSGVTLRGGRSSAGGGLYAAEDAAIMLRAVVLEENAATGRGGGLYTAAGTAGEISDSIIRSNTAGDAGGGVYGDGVLVITNTTVSHNRAESTVATRGRGGGLYVATGMVASNSTLYANTATSQGGGIYAAEGAVGLTNLTIAANGAQSAGGGIYIELAAVESHNTVIAGNLRGTVAPDDAVGSFQPSSSHSFLGAGASSTGITDGVNNNRVGTEAAPLDARLRPLGAYGGPVPTAAPRSDSPLHEAGSNAAALAAALTSDQRGLVRVADQDGDGAALVDIGAVETTPLFIVDGTFDETFDTDGKLSLREALRQAKQLPGLDVIRFSPSLWGSVSGGAVTLPVSAGSLPIDSDLEIEGPRNAKVTLDADYRSGIAFVSAATAALSDLTIRRASGAASGITNVGTLVLDRVLLTENRGGGSGGAIWNSGSLTLLNSTVSGNTAGGPGAGIFNGRSSVRAPSVLAINSTIYGNRCDAAGRNNGTGGGIYITEGGVVTLQNTAVAGNRRGSGAGVPDDVFGAFATPSTFNFIGVIDGSSGLEGAGTQFGTAAAPADPWLTPLGDHGGPTLSHGLLPGSPLTDSGSNGLASAESLTVDQRGLPRVRDGNGDALARIDKGAYEQQVPLNIAPSLSDVNTIGGGVEGRPLTISFDKLLQNSDASDPDGAISGFLIESLTAGTLTVNGQPVVAGQTTLAPGQAVTWTPPAIDFGADRSRDVLAFSVRASDGQVLSPGAAAVTINVTSVAEPVNYVVLFSGGDKRELNYPIYYQNLKRLYQVVTTRYGVRPDDVYVIYADGRDSGVDQKGGANSDMSFASNVLPATRYDLRSTLVDLSRRVDANDHLMVWTFDHGLGTTARPDIAGEEVIRGWGSQETITDKQLAVWLQGLKSGESGASFGVPEGYGGISAGFTSYVFAQCFAGGMLDNLTLNPANTFGAASSNHYEASYSDYFASGFTEALERGYNNSRQAFSYAFHKDGRAQGGLANGNNGMWSFNVEHPWMTEGNFPLFATTRALNAVPQVRSVTPLKLPASATELTITYDLLKAAVDADDPTGQALSYRITSVAAGQLLRPDGQAVNLSDPSQSTISYGTSLVWRKPAEAGAGTVLNALQMVVRAPDGEESPAAVNVPVRIGEPAAGGVVARGDAKALQSGGVGVLVDVLDNDDGAGLRVLRVGQPLHGSLTVDQGQVRYTPAAEYLGPDVFSYVAGNADGTSSDVAQVSLSVVPYDPGQQPSQELTRYSLTELPPPPGWAGLPAADSSHPNWTESYLSSIPAWTGTSAVDVSDDGVVLVKTSRSNVPGNPYGPLDFVGSTNASYRWQSGDVEPYWNRSPDGSVVASNALMLLLEARHPDTGAALLHDGREIYNGIEGRSVRDPSITPHTRYLDPDNANEAGFPSIGGVWYDVGTGGELWQGMPQDLFPVDAVASSQANAAQLYLLAANRASASAGSRAQLWRSTPGAGSAELVRSLDGWGGSLRSSSTAMNQSGQVVGWAEYASDDYHAFLWDGVQMRDLGAADGHAESTAMAVNASGTAVGFSGSNIGVSSSGVATIWSAGGGAASVLPSLGGSGWSVAYDLNDAGLIVGASNGKAVAWVNGAVQELNGLVNGLPSGVVLTEARGINKAGQIIATGAAGGQTRAYFLDLTSALDAVSDNVETSSRRSVTFNVLGNDRGAASVSAVSTSNLEGQLSWSSDGQMSYDPAGLFNDLQPGQTRTTSFTYTARDNLGGQKAATVTLSVRGRTMPVDDEVAAVEDTPLSIPVATLLANDDPGLAVTAVSGTSDTRGSVSLNGGVISWVPQANYNGPASFTYTVSDGSASSSATVRLAIAEVNDVPVAADDARTTQQNTTLSLAASSLTLNDLPGPPNEQGQVLTVVAVAATADTHGAVSLGTDGTIRYVSTTGFFGAASFSYVVRDGGTTNGAVDARESTGTVQLLVMPGNDILPSWLAPGSAATWNAGTKTLTVTGAATIVADPGPDVPVITANGPAAVVTFNPSSGRAVHIGGLTLTGGATATLASVTSQAAATATALTLDSSTLRPARGGAVRPSARPKPQLTSLLAAAALRTAANSRVLVVNGDTFNIDASSKLDLADNNLILNYSGASPAAGVEGMVKAGFNGGDWLGKRVTSSSANVDRNFALAVSDNSRLVIPFSVTRLFAGEAVDTTAVLVKFTHRVDLDLDGVITTNDATIFNSNYGEGAAARWGTGDVDFDGLFTSNDATLFNSYYDESLGAV